MKKILISILALLLLPTLVLAADELTFNSDTDLTVGAYTLVILNGAVVDQMEVGASSVTFTLSANSGLTLRSNSRANMTSNLGLDVLCGDAYSQISTSGNSSGSTLTVTPSGTCVSTSGGGGGGGGGGTVTTPTTTTVPTTTTGQVTATASGGGKTTLTTDENTKAVVELPAAAVSASTAIKVDKTAKATATGSRALPSGRSVVGSYVYDFTATANSQTVSTFSKTLTLTFTYTDAQISGLDESALLVYYWKDSTSQWTALPTTVNASTNTLTATTNHFTYFAVLGRTAEAATEETPPVAEEQTPAAPVAEVTISDGDLVRNPNASGLAQFDVYIVKLVGAKKFKRLILSPHVFNSYGHLSWNSIKDVSQIKIDEYTTSDLVRALNDTKVYKLTPSGDTGQKQWLNITYEQFVSQGYDADSIYTINNTDRDAYETGAEITVQAATQKTTIIIKVSTLRVRSLPSLSGNILATVKQGEVYDLLEEQSGWYKITTKDGQTGWCYGGDTGGYAAKQ